MGRYKIVYDRPGCIGAGACVAVAPEVWEMKDDAKASIINGNKISEELEELEFDDEMLEKIKESAEVCPVNVIHIIDTKTGEKII